jgi:hypothetical protein
MSLETDAKIRADSHAQEPREEEPSEDPAHH